MMKRLKEFLTSFLKSNGNVYRYIAWPVVIIAWVIIYRCEVKDKVRAEAEAQKAKEILEKKEKYIEYQNHKFDSLLNVHEYLKIEADGVKVENSNLRAQMDDIDSIFTNTSKSKLKDVFSKYKGYRMRNSR